MWVNLGKIGDVLSSLPMLRYKSEQQRQPANLVISQQYSDVVAGLDYIKPDVLNIHWQDLEEGIKHAKRKYSKVFVPQTYGRTVAIQHRQPSWQLDQWSRCGMLHWWDKLPLVLPRPANAEEIVGRHMERGRAILFADQGESSPFESREALAQRLSAEFGKSHQIVRLSTIRLERFTDFLALYDAAACLVVTETSHLHLSKACDRPIFALATDTPERWHGSAWSQKFKLHIRYSQYRRREQELIAGIRSVL